MPAEILTGVSHADYHADRLPGSPRFSRSCAVTILQRSPLHAWHEHPALGGQREGDSTDAADHGSLVHELMLGGGQDLVPVRIHHDKAKLGPLVDAEDFRTLEAQGIRDAARAVGKIPVLPRKLEAAKEAATCLRARMAVVGIPLADCQKELTILWDERLADGREVKCKARIDLLHGASGWVWDLKFPARGTPGTHQRAMLWNGGVLQALVYQRAVGAAWPELAGRVDFAVLWCESWGPAYDVAVIPVSPSQLSLAEMQWARALRLWANALETGTWQGYGTLAPMEAPPYALESELAAAYAANAEPEWVSGKEG